MENIRIVENGLPPRRSGYPCRMRIMFGIYTALIVAGIVFFTIVGLTHG